MHTEDSIVFLLPSGRICNLHLTQVPTFCDKEFTLSKIQNAKDVANFASTNEKKQQGLKKVEELSKKDGYLNWEIHNVAIVETRTVDKRVYNSVTTIDKKDWTVIIDQFNKYVSEHPAQYIIAGAIFETHYRQRYIHGEV